MKPIFDGESDSITPLHATSSNLPSGTVTFLFTDIEGSTPFWEREPDSIRLALDRHHDILRQAIETHAGRVFKIVGDAFLSAFSLPSQAVEAAVAAQRQFAAQTWPTSAPVRVRMGIHIGPAVTEGSDYVTTHTLNRVARIMAAARGGQILLSLEVSDLMHGYLPAGVSLLDMGQHRLKGLSQLEHLFQIVTPDLPADFPPLESAVLSPNNLPIQLTSCIGREKEIEEVKHLLADVPLVTLTGPGGTGKTGLSLEIAADLLGSFPDGGWLVELAPLSDPQLVPQAVAAVWSVREHQDDRPWKHSQITFAIKRFYWFWITASISLTLAPGW